MRATRLSKLDQVRRGSETQPYRSKVGGQASSRETITQCPHLTPATPHLTSPHSHILLLLLQLFYHCCSHLISPHSAYTVCHCHFTLRISFHFNQVAPHVTHTSAISCITVILTVNTHLISPHFTLTTPQFTHTVRHLTLPHFTHPTNHLTISILFITILPTLPLPTSTVISSSESHHTLLVATSHQHSVQHYLNLVNLLSPRLSPPPFTSP